MPAWYYIQPILKVLIIFGVTVWVLLNVFQWIGLKQLRKNWIFITDARDETAERYNNMMPPMDGMVLTFLVSFVPVLNLCYLYFIASLCFLKDGDNKLYMYRGALRRQRRDK